MLDDPGNARKGASGGEGFIGVPKAQDGEETPMSAEYSVFCSQKPGLFYAVQGDRRGGVPW